jgi:hypothetical protein
MAKRGSGKSERNVLAIPLNAGDDRVVNQLFSQYGMSKAELVRRVLLWVGDAPQSVQYAVLGLPLGEMRDEAARRACEHLKKTIGMAAAPEMPERPTTKRSPKVADLD